MMFSTQELFECTGEPWFRECFQTCERTLLLARLGLPSQVDLGAIPYDALRFSQAVLASVPGWGTVSLPDAEAGRLLLQAGDIESAFALFAEMLDRHDAASLHLLHASVLYDLASLPGSASSQALRNGMFPSVQHFFSRSPESLWGHLKAEAPRADPDTKAEPLLSDDGKPFRAVNCAIGESLIDFGNQLQRFVEDAPANGEADLELIRVVSSNYNTEITSDLINALRSAVIGRFRNSVLNVLPEFSSLPATLLRQLKIPSELWPAQLDALKHGMLNPSFTSFGLAAPTGTGKTASTRVLLADFLTANPDSRALYVVPTRALAAQVTIDLSASLSAIGMRVVSLGRSPNTRRGVCFHH